MEKLEVPMMEQVEFARGARNLPECACLKIESKEDMQFYSAKVQFRARFTGLRYLPLHPFFTMLSDVADRDLGGLCTIGD